MRHRVLRKLLGLSRAEWVELFWGQGALIHAQLLVWTRPRGRLLAASEPSAGPGGQRRDATPEMHRLARAVERVADYGLYRPSCLVRSLALQRLLAARGIHSSTVRVGVRLAGGHFTAHAWVECDGQVLGDRDWRVKEFDELAQLEEHQPS
jgi:transglutaminase superfamily protein